jgi:DMSO/TMAO reductase YedYZ heme-binding membrane subunit
MSFLTYQLGFLSALIFFAVIHVWGRFIHKHATIILWTFFIIALLTVFIDIPVVSEYIKSGHGSLGLFMLVIISGILPKKSFFYKDLLLVRGHIAVLAFILLIPHGLERLYLALAGYQFTGLIAMILMIPLTITSFMFIRKKMKPIHWKNLHKLSYLAYVMIYIHIGFTIYLSSSTSYIVIMEDAILYHLFAIIYIFFKVRKTILRKKNKQPSS